MFTTLLLGVKYKDIVFIAIYNQWESQRPYLIERPKKVGIFVSPLLI